MPFSRPLRATICAATLIGVALHAAPARAGDEAAAEALFVEATKLASAGKFAEACPKFAESNRLDRGAGTLIHLADCYEKTHKTASAWATYKDAASAAQALNRADWQKLATTRAAALEPKLAKMTIKVVDPADKIEVTRDGSTTSPASWGTPIPVDTGSHVVAATAPGRKPFTTTVTVSNDGDHVEALVTKLEVGAAVAGPATPSGKRDDGSGQRTIGFVLGGVGVAGLAVGAVTGLIAIGKNKDSKSACPSDGACASSEAVSKNSSAKTFGLVSTIAFIVGGAGVAGGAILIFTAPSDTSSTQSAWGTKPGIRIVPDADAHSGNITVMGVF